MINTSDFRLLTSCLNNAFMKLNFFCSSVLLFGFGYTFFFVPRTATIRQQHPLHRHGHRRRGVPSAAHPAHSAAS
jgi:hypothetical protein